MNHPGQLETSAIEHPPIDPPSLEKVYESVLHIPAQFGSEFENSASQAELNIGVFGGVF
jgi:hypothetical protein